MKTQYMPPGLGVNHKILCVDLWISGPKWAQNLWINGRMSCPDAVFAARPPHAIQGEGRGCATGIIHQRSGEVRTLEVRTLEGRAGEALAAVTRAGFSADRCLRAG